jgi:drug/metabolite transporter (DMT)-like permease
VWDGFGIGARAIEPSVHRAHRSSCTMLSHDLLAYDRELTLNALRSRSAGMLCLVVTSVGWGVNWSAMKFLMRELPPLFARGVAGVTAALIIAVIAVALGERLKVQRGEVGRFAAASFFNVFAWMGFSTLSMRWLGAGEGALLVYTMPIWATLMAWPILGKRPTGRSIAGLALCFGGVSLLFGGHEFALGADKIPGVAFALAAAILFALGTIVMAPLTLPPFASLAWQLAIGCTPMVIIGLLFEHPDFSALTPRGWSLLAYMTIGPMGICYITWFAALRRLPPATASVATLLTPVVGVTAAALFLGEPLGAKEWLAMGMTIGGVALVMRKS